MYGVQYVRYWYVTVTFAGRIVMRPLMHTKYMTTGYRVSGEKHIVQGQLFGHITSFPKPLPGTIKEALEEIFRCLYHSLRV